MLLDYKPLRGRIATRVGKVLGKNPNNHKRGDPTFLCDYGSKMGMGLLNQHGRGEKRNGKNLY
jgi:hypothetical protein